MDSRDDLAALCRKYLYKIDPTYRYADQYVLADAILNAGWMPADQAGVLFERVRAERDALAATVQRVEALAEQWERWAADATKRGYPSPEDGLTFAQETHARNLRRTLDGPGEEDG